MIKNNKTKRGADMDLIKYDEAKKAIAAYESVDEVKDFRDKAVAIEAYAKQGIDVILK